MKKAIEHEETERSGAATLIAVARDHPVLTGTLFLLMVVGATLSWLFLPGDLSGFRRIAGGALLGGLSWLLVMMGRLLD